MTSGIDKGTDRLTRTLEDVAAAPPHEITRGVLRWVRSALSSPLVLLEHRSPEGQRRNLSGAAEGHGLTGAPWAWIDSDDNGFGIRNLGPVPDGPVAHCVMSTPVTIGGEVVGVLRAARTGAGYSTDDLTRLQQAAAILGSGLERKHHP